MAVPVVGWLTKALAFLPGIGKIFDKIAGHSEEAAKYRAQAHLEEAKAFRQGRLAPRYVRSYVWTAIISLVALTILFSIFFPDLVKFEWHEAIKAVRVLFDEPPNGM